jgi:hypothetical protein
MGGGKELLKRKNIYKLNIINTSNTSMFKLYFKSEENLPKNSSLKFELKWKRENINKKKGRKIRKRKRKRDLTIAGPATSLLAQEPFTSAQPKYPLHPRSRARTHCNAGPAR